MWKFKLSSKTGEGHERGGGVLDVLSFKPKITTKNIETNTIRQLISYEALLGLRVLLWDGTIGIKTPLTQAALYDRNFDLKFFCTEGIGFGIFSLITSGFQSVVDGRRRYCHAVTARSRIPHACSFSSFYIVLEG